MIKDCTYWWRGQRKPTPYWILRHFCAGIDDLNAPCHIVLFSEWSRKLHTSEHARSCYYSIFRTMFHQKNCWRNTKRQICKLKEGFYCSPSYSTKQTGVMKTSSSVSEFAPTCKNHTPHWRSLGALFHSCGACANTFVIPIFLTPFMRVGVYAGEDSQKFSTDMCKSVCSGDIFKDIWSHREMSHY